MPNRTLYVSEEDEQAWEDAKNFSDGGTESLSRLAAEGLRMVIAQRRTGQASPMDYYRAAVARFLRELRTFGWEKTGSAFARACMEYGAERARAKIKAETTLGPQGRSAASRIANQNRGAAGRSLAAKRAAQKRKGGN